MIEHRDVRLYASQAHSKIRGSSTPIISTTSEDKTQKEIGKRESRKKARPVVDRPGGMPVMHWLGSRGVWIGLQSYPCPWARGTEKRGRHQNSHCRHSPSPDGTLPYCHSTHPDTDRYRHRHTPYFGNTHGNTVTHSTSNTYTPVSEFHPQRFQISELWLFRDIYVATRFDMDVGSAYVSSTYLHETTATHKPTTAYKSTDRTSSAHQSAGTTASAYRPAGTTTSTYGSTNTATRSALNKIRRRLP